MPAEKNPRLEIISFWNGRQSVQQMNREGWGAGGREMPVAEFLRLYPDYPVAWDQLVYARYMERQGKRFLVDFGFDNAEAMAWDHLENGDFLLGHA